MDCRLQDLPRLGGWLSVRADNEGFWGGRQNRTQTDGRLNVVTGAICWGLLGLRMMQPVYRSGRDAFHPEGEMPLAGVGGRRERVERGGGGGRTFYKILGFRILKMSC